MISSDNTPRANLPEVIFLGTKKYRLIHNKGVFKTDEEHNWNIKPSERHAISTELIHRYNTYRSKPVSERWSNTDYVSVMYILTCVAFQMKKIFEGTEGSSDSRGLYIMSENTSVFWQIPKNKTVGWEYIVIKTRIPSTNPDSPLYADVFSPLYSVEVFDIIEESRMFWEEVDRQASRQQ